MIRVMWGVLFLLVASCDFFSSNQNEAEVADFEIYDHPVYLYGKDFDKYLGVDRNKQLDKDKVFGVWDGGYVSEDAKGFKKYAYFKISGGDFYSIIVCVREEPYLVGYTETKSKLGFEDNDVLTISNADRNIGLFFDNDGNEFGCEVGPIPAQRYNFSLEDGKLKLFDKNTDYEFFMNRYY